MNPQKKPRPSREIIIFVIVFEVALCIIRNIINIGLVAIWQSATVRFFDVIDTIHDA